MIKIYDEQGNELETYDPNLGHVTLKQKEIHHPAVEAVEEKGHYEVAAEYPNGGKDLQWVVDVPGVEGKEAYVTYEDYYLYTPYTQEELDRMEEERNKPDLAQRVTAIEEQLASYEKAYMEGVQSL